MKDVLVVYYSRTGSTRQLAQRIAAMLDADLEEIHEAHKRLGAFGFLRSLYDVARGRQPRIDAPRHDPRLYKMVLIGSPVWAGHVSSPVRSYLVEHAGGLRRLGFFCSLRGSGATETLAEMAALHDPQAETIEHGRYPSVAVTEAQLRSDDNSMLDGFVADVRARLRGAAGQGRSTRRPSTRKAASRTPAKAKRRERRSDVEA